MRPTIIKAYGFFYPATRHMLKATHDILSSWFIDEAAELKNDLLTISYEGDIFPDEDVAALFASHASEGSKGRLDIIDLEAWTLRRWLFEGKDSSSKTVTLNKALDTSLL